MRKQVLVKVSGDRVSVEECVAIMRKVFPIAIVGNIRSNDRDSGVHCFLDLDASITRMEAQPT